jgi:uncharacterized protein
MKKKLENLLEFQKAEIEIGRLTDILRSVSEKLEALDARQASFQEAFEKDSTAMDHLKKRYRALESDVQTNESRVAKSQDKLSAVKTNKEYQAILKEMEDIKEMNSALEDEMIVCLEQMESFETNLSEKNRALKQLQGQIASEKDSIRRDADDNTKRLKEVERLQARLSAEVDKALMADYIQVKRMVKHLAVVPVLQSVCQGCHRKIPPQMFIELQRSDQLKFCPHCDRLVFWDDTFEQ